MAGQLLTQANAVVELGVCNHGLCNQGSSIHHLLQVRQEPFSVLLVEILLRNRGLAGETLTLSVLDEHNTDRKLQLRSSTSTMVIVPKESGPYFSSR